MGERVVDWTRAYEVYLMPTEKDQLVHELAQRYHDETEAYDRTVCTGPVIDGSIRPVTGREMGLISANAKKKFDELLREAELATAEAEVVTSLRDAIRKHRGGSSG